MPMQQGRGRKAVSANVRKLRHEGMSQDQAVAAAMNVAGKKAGKKAVKKAQPTKRQQAAQNTAAARRARRNS